MKLLKRAGRRDTLARMRTLAPFALLALLAVALPVGCGDSDDDSGQSGTGGAQGRDEEGLRMCCVLGALCHRPGEQSNAEMQACHELGHENDPDACREGYQDCLDICAAGGAGGAASEHACL